jgi:hypothetical protein
MRNARIRESDRDNRHVVGRDQRQGLPSHGRAWEIPVAFRRENSAWLNRFALSLLKQHPGRQSLAMKRRCRGWSDDFLMEAVTGSTSYVCAGSDHVSTIHLRRAPRYHRPPVSKPLRWIGEPPLGVAEGPAHSTGRGSDITAGVFIQPKCRRHHPSFRNGENLGQVAESVFTPLLPVLKPRAAEESPVDAA